LCSVLGRRGQIDEAIEHCEQALRLAPDSPYNKVQTAAALLARHGVGDIDRSTELAGAAAAALPEEAFALEIWCAGLLQAGDTIALQGCSRRLLALDPNSLAANLSLALLAGDAGDLDEARLRLENAKAAGLAQQAYDEILAKIDEAEQANATFPRWAHQAFGVGAWIVGIWVAVIVLLLFTGFALSKLTLRAIERSTGATAHAEGSAGERRLRRIYKAVLLLSGMCFYLSIPILLATIVAAGLGLLAVFLAIGAIPVKLVLLIGIVVIVTIGAIVKSLFVRSDGQPPGEPLDLGKHPKLRAMLDDVAGVVGTRPVDVAYVLPGAEMAVTERGSLWASLRGKATERSLIMGIALFEGMTQLQLRSILAHEYGHFRNQDTAGGGFALAVRRSLFSLIIRLAQSGAAGWYNPAWWFVRGFHRMYLAISQGASRLQEVLADRWAIHAYGSAGFIAGYRHVVARSVEFDRGVDATLKDVIDNERPLPNLYAYDRTPEATEAEDLATCIERELVREPSLYDSHPAPRQRLEWAERLAVQRTPQAGDDAPVWDLFTAREALERAMTSQVREGVFANHGILIPETEDVPTAPAASAPSESAQA
ncbi:MAG: M48 family metalloprotease, partial [Kofleriaceae bacterium]